MPTLDTNIIVRHLTADHPDHSPRAHRLFQELAAGATSAALREAVLVEPVQVLSSKILYNPSGRKSAMICLSLFALLVILLT